MSSTTPTQSDLDASTLLNQLETLKHKNEQLLQANMISNAAFRYAEHSRTMLEEAYEKQKDILANISHEMRTPLHAITGYLDLLDHSALDEKQTRYTGEMRSATQRISLMIENLIDMTSLLNQSFKIYNTEFPLEEWLEQLQSKFMPFIKNKGLALNLSIAKSIPSSITSDQLLLDKILSHLLDNAIKFSESGTITLGIEQNNQGYLCFIVQDEGIGMDSTKQHAMFELFNQSDTSLTRQHEGLGLGLTICNHLVELMNGAIHIKSQEGKGTQISVTLPLD